MALMQHLLFFTQKTLAFFYFSGIITTNLGKTATHTEIAGRKKTDTSLQNMPSSVAGGGYFFVPVKCDQKLIKA